MGDVGAVDAVGAVGAVGAVDAKDAVTGCGCGCGPPSMAGVTGMVGGQRATTKADDRGSPGEIARKGSFKAITGNC